MKALKNFNQRWKSFIQEQINGINRLKWVVEFSEESSHNLQQLEFVDVRWRVQDEEYSNFDIDFQLDGSIICIFGKHEIFSNGNEYYSIGNVPESLLDKSEIHSLEDLFQLFNLEMETLKYYEEKTIEIEDKKNG